ncbi:hypothetical protein TcCL_Unassigned04836 [Trypanosoma cruzi]|nr:hypothetical protein TcCL_Unassigned04836 [Trypanosoma cruzi]
MAAAYKKRDAVTSISVMVEELSAGMAHTDRTNLSLRDTVWSVIKLHPQKGVLRSARFAILPHRGVTAVRITKHLGFPQCRIASRPCNAYITDPNVVAHQWRCGPEAVNHRRHPRNCRSNGLENFWAGLVSHWEPCKLHQRAVLHAASKEMPGLPR